MLLWACSVAPASQPQDEPGIVHVHALAFDPGDPSALYVATHTGLFRLDGENRAQRVGDECHDLMGFTVAGPGDFVASGHPDLRTQELQAPGKPPLLGLVHSSDNGARWQPLSLLGEVDFHSLEVAHGLVYGSDSTSGRFMVSRDRTTWETRSSLSLADLAVSPTDADVVVASTEQGVVTSADGGRTWQRTTNQVFLVLDWTETGLYAIAPDGSVGISRNGGTNWLRQGSIGGRPEALVAGEEGRLAAAASNRGIVESQDGGQTWMVRLASDGSPGTDH
jgi:hypothetical protein